MLESYIWTPDGKEYVDTDCVMEALGIKDDEDIFLAIKKLREDKDLLEELHANHIDQLKEHAELGFELGIGSGDAESIKDYIISLKKERDELKEKCNKLKARANALYGDSCGYSASKQPAFRCDVIESVDYQNAKAARAELAYLYKTVLGKDRLDRDLSPHEVMKEILDEYKRRNEFIRELSYSLGFGNPVVKPDNIYQKEKDILERIEGLKTGVWPCENPSTFAKYLRKEFPKLCKEYSVAPLNCTYPRGGSVHDWIQYIFGVLADYRDHANDKVNNYIDELCDKYNVVQPIRSSQTRARIDYIFSVLAENRERYNSEWKWVEQLKKEKRTVVDSLAELRAKVREIYRSVVDDEWDESLSYISALNDINEEYKRVVRKLKDDGCNAEKEFLDAVKKRIGVSADCSDNAYMLRLLDIKLDHSALSTFTDNVYEELGLPRYGYTLTETIYNLKNRLDCDARLRSNICTALGLGGETSKNSNSDIINRAIAIRESHEKLCKDYTELRKAIWEAMDRKPETLPVETARLVGEVAELARGEKLLIEFRDDVAKAIGMDYPTTNQVILHNVRYIYKDREDAYGMVSKLNDQVTALEKAKEDLQQMLIDSQKQVKDQGQDLCELRKNAIEELKSRGFLFRYEEDETLPEIYSKLLKRYDWTYGSYKEQYRLRQMWHARYESEHERANGEHKRAEKLLKDTTSLKNHIELLKISSSAKANELVALQAFKNECRKLRDEKTKVISAIGQDIWDDCVKEEENNE